MFCHVFICLCLYTPLLDLGRFFSFLILYTAGRAPFTGDQSVARPLHTHRTTQTQNKRTQTSMPLVGFEPTIPVFERVMTFHALDGAATVIGVYRCIRCQNLSHPAESNLFPEYSFRTIRPKLGELGKC
jgi:hypothetical protein